MQPTNQGIGVKAAKSDVADLEKMVAGSSNPEEVCAKIAHALHVRRGEIALMRVEKRSLRFLCPTELRSAGEIPLSGTSVAARTATTRAPLLSNTFMRVKHVSLFEAVRLKDEEEDLRNEQMPIQKIISVPVMEAGGKVLGVVQVSRKGLDASLAGPDFSHDDLKLLEKAGTILARMPFMKEAAAGS
jgi:hypothetical protein